MTKLGIIGMSEGNGHPYSWSSIINGYSPEHLAKCGFPAIYDYMMENQQPTTFFCGCRVTCVLSQHKNISEKISACANIPFIVNDTLQLVEQVDAVLLARDDAENHLFYANDALNKGLPIFIDKPIALSVNALENIYRLAQDQKMIFSCSALRFSDEILLSIDEQKNIGKIIEINCKTPKSWDKYAVHLIDPLIHIMKEIKYLKVSVLISNRSQRKIKVWWENDISSTIEASEQFSGQIQFTYVGTSGQITKKFTNSYDPFRKSLLNFVKNINTKIYFDEYEKLKRIVELIQIGKSS